MIKDLLRTIAGVIVLTGFCSGFVFAQDQWQWPEKPQNLQVFPKEWTGERLAPVMTGFTRAFGVRLRLNTIRTAIRSVEVLESNNPLFDEPTLGVVSRDSLFFLANSQWSRIDDKGIARPDSNFTFPLILRLSL